MLLQPRHFVFKRRQKKRTLLSFNNSQSYLSFGSSGLLITRPIHLTSNQLFKFKLFLKRACKKPDRTRRFVWFHAFPHLPLTRKPNGVRMGKGKGKLECWFTNIRGGTTLIEFKNLRRGRAYFFMKQLSHRLGVPVLYLFNYDKCFNYPLNFSKKIFLRNFW